MVGSGPSGETPRGDFCQPWRGQAAARLNRRATRPNAIRDRDINDKVDPASGTVRCRLRSMHLGASLFRSDAIGSDVCSVAMEWGTS